MLRYTQLIFDDVVQGTTPVIIAPTWDEPMGLDDAWTVCAIASLASGTTPALFVDALLSVDGLTWLDLGPVLGASLSTTDKTMVVTPAIIGIWSHMRFQLSLTGTNPSAHVQLWFTARDPMPMG